MHVAPADNAGGRPLFAFLTSGAEGCRMERREAQRTWCRPRKPASCGARASGQDSQPCPRRTARGWPDRKGSPHGASQAPGASRRSIPLLGKRKRDGGLPGAFNNAGDYPWLFEKFAASASQVSTFSAAMNASCGISTLPNSRTSHSVLRRRLR